MSIQNVVYYISYEDIQNQDILFNDIYSKLETNYYISDDFSKDFYIYLAYLGFISTSITLESRLQIPPS